mmetsp:Transcript_282/g.895  ORF Transcript_282/g.895 Transcript_282/m.895 type:complete len:110 (+) Transcript_282:766-1095(+)
MMLPARRQGCRDTDTPARRAGVNIKSSCRQERKTILCLSVCLFFCEFSCAAVGTRRGGGEGGGTLHTQVGLMRTCAQAQTQKGLPRIKESLSQAQQGPAAKSGQSAVRG